LECAGFSGAVERAENLERRIISVRTKSGAEVTAVQTLRAVERVTPCAPSEVSTMRMEHGSLSRSVLECAVFSGAFRRAANPERRVILVRTKSGAEATATSRRSVAKAEVQTLREFRSVAAFGRKPPSEN
jgi:hypothetical protein